MDSFYDGLYEKLKPGIKDLVKKFDCELEDLAFAVGYRSEILFIPGKTSFSLLKTLMEGLPTDDFKFHAFVFWYNIENDIIYGFEHFEDAIADMARNIKGLMMYDLCRGQTKTVAKALIRGISKDRKIKSPWFEVEFKFDGTTADVAGFKEVEYGVKEKGVDKVLCAITQFDKAQGEPPDPPEPEKKPEAKKDPILTYTGKDEWNGYTVEFTPDGGVKKTGVVYNDFGKRVDIEVSKTERYIDFKKKKCTIVSTGKETKKSDSLLNCRVSFVPTYDDKLTVYGVVIRDNGGDKVDVEDYKKSVYIVERDRCKVLFRPDEPIGGKNKIKIGMWVEFGPKPIIGKVDSIIESSGPKEKSHKATLTDLEGQLWSVDVEKLKICKDQYPKDFKVGDEISWLNWENKYMEGVITKISGNAVDAVDFNGVTRYTYLDKITKLNRREPAELPGEKAEEKKDKKDDEKITQSDKLLPAPPAPETKPEEKTESKPDEKVEIPEIPVPHVHLALPDKENSPDQPQILHIG